MSSNQPEQRLPVKVYEAEERLMIATPMPGLEPGDIIVEVTRDNVLRLQGQARGAFKDQKHVHTDEWDAGPYGRELPLPASVDAEMANVTYHNGILVVALPLAEQTRAARLTLDRIAPDYGERVGNSGHPVRARTNHEHQAGEHARTK
jgi:HSP20 family protein